MGYPRHKYINITRNTLNSQCSQYLLGNSEIVKVETDSGTGHTILYIGGPNHSYILELGLDDDSELTVKFQDADNSCKVEGFYDLTTYASDNGINAKLSCINKPGCNYESDTIVATEGGDDDDGGLCNSCSLYPNEEDAI